MTLVPLLRKLASEITAAAEKSRVFFEEWGGRQKALGRGGIVELIIKEQVGEKPVVGKTLIERLYKKFGIPRSDISRVIDDLFRRKVLYSFRGENIIRLSTPGRRQLEEQYPEEQYPEAI